MIKLLFRLFLLAAIPIGFAIAYFYQVLNFWRPQTDSVIYEVDTTDNVHINRDQYGTVYIEAKSDDDTFFALGFVHAQDRLWQLELQRRTAKGRLSELFGIQSANFDAQLRTLQFYRAAESAWTVLSDEAKQSLTQYTAGINHWINNANSLPIEFSLLGITPEPWTELDSLAWSKVFALNLSQSMWDEITLYLASPYLNKQQRAELFPDYPSAAPVTVSNDELDDRETFLSMLNLQQEMQKRLKIGGKYVGSNAWAISGKLTESGHAISANDPHLGLQIPSIWYAASLKGHKINASGMTLVGFPIIVFGHNQAISWGGTNMMADTQDLYFEQVNGDNANQYQNDNEWVDFTTTKEYIQVRGDFPSVLKNPIKPIELNIRSTTRGPIINDTFGIVNQPVSLRWTGLDKEDTTYEALYRLNYATDWDSFRDALKYHVSPTLNFVYSDQSGNIGYQAAGKIPVRGTGKGAVTLTGSEKKNQWQGFIPFSQLPYSFNPKKGYIISANNKIVGDEYPYHLSSNWAPPARASRIQQLIQQALKQNKTLSLEFMKHIQADTTSYGAIALTEVLASAPMKTAKQITAQKYVKQWQHDMHADSQGATIFYTWTKNLRAVLFSDELTAPYGQRRSQGIIESAYKNTTYNQIASSLTSGAAQWCDNVMTVEVETCTWAMQRSLNLTIKELTKLRGNDMEDWKWGNIHETVYTHTPFSQVNILNRLFERRIANGGGPNTVNVATANFVSSRGYEQGFGAGFRQVVHHLPTGIEYEFMNSTGQSGNIFSEHYDDMIEAFRNVEYIKMHTSNIQSKLILKPGKLKK